MFELRPYQHTAIENVKLAIRKGKKSIMVCSPTGSGKGVMLSHIINQAAIKGSKVLFLVHRQEILYQISDYLQKYDVPHGIIKAGEYWSNSHTTNVASIQTLYSRRERINLCPADVVIIDEAHHATAPTYKKVIDRFTGRVMIGFSATPARKTGMGLGNMFDELIQVATIQQLTDMGFLVPIRYFAPVVPDLTGVKVTAGDYNQKQLDQVMSGQLVGDMVEWWFKVGEGRQTVVFASGVAHSVAIRQKFEECGVITAHLDGETLADERKDIIDRYRKGEIQILTNCAILTEGVDVPNISCVILARPTKSLPLYMQMVGRGMRPAPGKDNMILLDHAGAVYEHGMCHEITEWELEETKETVNKKNEKRKKAERKPITCPKCKAVYTGQLACPDCGNIPEKNQFGKDVEYIDGELGELCMVSKKAKEKVYTTAEKREWYAQIKDYALEHGKSESFVNALFKAKFDVWPNAYKGTQPKTCGPEVYSWIRSRMIAYAKRKESGNNGNGAI